jgi:hypothetical protein
MIFIKDIVVVNRGGLTLPEGAQLFVISSDTIQAFDDFIALPEIRPGQSVQLQQTLRAQIIEMPPPTTKGSSVLRQFSHTLTHSDTHSLFLFELLCNCDVTNELFSSGVLRQRAELRLVVELWKRHVSGSGVSIDLDVTWPVTLSKCAPARERIFKGEVSSLVLHISNLTNVSTFPLPVKLIFITQKGLIPRIDLFEETNPRSSSLFNFNDVQTTYNEHELVTITSVMIKQFVPNHTTLLKFPIEVSSEVISYARYFHFFT